MVARILLAHRRTELDPKVFVVLDETPCLGDQSSRSSKFTLGSDDVCRLKADEFRGGRYDRQFPDVLVCNSLHTMLESMRIGWFEIIAIRSNFDLGISESSPAETIALTYGGRKKDELIDF
jgi:hypothetical protein